MATTDESTDSPRDTADGANPNAEDPGEPSPSPGNPASGTTSISQTTDNEPAEADVDAETSQGEPSDSAGGDGS